MGASPAQIREHYDSLALIYRAFWGDHIHHGLFAKGDETPEQAQLRLLEAAAALVEVPPGGRALDVGCGHGGTAVFLAQRYGCSAVGVTLSEKQARLARQRAAEAGVLARTAFVVADAGEFDFGRERYDLIWTMESSEHFPHKADYLRRAAQALAPGGRMLLAAWTGSMEDAQVRAVARAFLCPSLETAGEYVGQMEAAGLEVFQGLDLTAEVLHTWEICREHARRFSAALPLLPARAREFVEGIPVILNAYRSGALRYSMLAARK
jgi:tocopherol O-methyltransferase